MHSYSMFCFTYFQENMSVKRQRNLRTNNTIKKWSQVRTDVLLRQKKTFLQKIADSPIAPHIASVIPLNWRLSALPHTIINDKMGFNSVKVFSEMYQLNFDETWENVKRFKMYILNEHDSQTAPSTIGDTVQLLAAVKDKKNLQICYNLYCHLLSAINHAMWIEQWNSFAGMYTGGKMHEKNAETCTWKMNIKINAPILALVNLSIPAALYTLKVARQAKKGDKNDEQYQYHDIYWASYIKYQSG
eukprot:464488_1